MREEYDPLVSVAMQAIGERLDSRAGWFLDIVPIAGQVTLKAIVGAHLRGEGRALAILGGSASPESAANFFVDMSNEFPEIGDHLRPVVADLISDWGQVTSQELLENPKPLSELLFVCGCIDAKEAIPALEKVAQRTDLGEIILSTGEPLDHKIKRVLDGLQAVDEDDVEEDEL